jgi:hypothetical protein
VIVCACSDWLSLVTQHLCAVLSATETSVWAQAFPETSMRFYMGSWQSQMGIKPGPPAECLPPAVARV